MLYTGYYEATDKTNDVGFKEDTILLEVPKTGDIREVRSVITYSRVRVQRRR